MGRMEKDPSDVLIRLEVPAAITKEWLDHFTETYGYGRCELDVMADSWLVQSPYYNGRYSTEFDLDGISDPSEGPQTIRGRLWYAADVPVTRYPDSSRIPAAFLVDARIVWANGTEQSIADDGNGQLAPELVMAPPDKRLVLVRLDSLKGDPPRSLKLRQLTEQFEYEQS